MTSAAAELDLRGGHPAIDIVNTVAWRGDPARRIDYLENYYDLVAWCRHSGVISAAESAELSRAMESDAVGAGRALAGAKRLREALHVVFTGPVPPALTTISEAYVSALRHSELRPAGDRIAWAERDLTLRSPLERIAVSTAKLIAEIPRDRVKTCGDSACGWLFLDGSHRQNRRWCSSADCGNRDRARRHYERSRG